MKRFIAKIKQNGSAVCWSLLACCSLIPRAGWASASCPKRAALPAKPEFAIGTDYIDTKSFAFMQPANLQAKVNPMAFRKNCRRRL